MTCVATGNNIWSSHAAFPAYALTGLAICWKFGLMRGQPKGVKFVTTPLFLKALRIYLFSLVWIPLAEWSFSFAWIAALYLPSYVSLSEYFGGRQSNSFQNGWLANEVKKYFGCRLVRTAEINEPCIIGMHPHGVMPFGHIVNLSTNVSGFEDMYPQLKNRVAIAATGCFIIPVFRDLLLAAGVVDCTRFAVEQWLEKKWTVFVFPGGTREALYSMPEREVLDLRRKVGFLELCMMHDVPVVPSYTFNEVDHLSQVSYWTVEKRYPLAFRARVHFQYLFGIILPFMKNIFPVRATGVKEGHVTVIGRPIRLPYTKEPPTKAQLEHSMEIYIAALQELYDTHAPLYSSRERELVIT